MDQREYAHREQEKKNTFFNSKNELKKIGR